MPAWRLPTESLIPPELSAEVGGHPLVTATLARRGILTPAAARAFLDPGVYIPAPSAELPGMEPAVEYLARAIHTGKVVCVWGDFDVDGQTSTTVLVATLRDLGANVRYHIPVRARESHGVGLGQLEKVLSDGANLVLTCDTGISAHDAVDLIHARGAQIIITDHHTLPGTLPPAEAVINPHLLPEGHPLGNLPGVGVAYKLAEALFAHFGRTGEAEQYLDLVALGIVADLAGLRADTRYLLQRGLIHLRSTHRLGLQTMLEYAEIAPGCLTEEHIGFSLGPRLNALGRLSDAYPAVELLTTTDLARARILAGELEGLNARRKMLTDQVYQAAQEMIARDPSLADRPSLVLAHPNWPAGVIGIVASRLVERYHKPVVLLSSSPGEAARGSARSVAGCDITAAIASQQQLLVGFGGHAMAAGLSIDPERIPEFQRGLNRAVHDQLGDVQEEPSLEVDAWLPLQQLSLDLVADFDRLAPFGIENPGLVLAARNMRIQSVSPVGRGGEHLQVTLQDPAGQSFKAIWWQGAGYELVEGQIDLAYTVRSADFRGTRTLSIEWVDCRPAETSKVSLQLSRQKIQVRDCRNERYPLVQLEGLRKKEKLQVWREGLSREDVAGVGRDELLPSEELVIWTSPPGPDELSTGVLRANPRVIYLFNCDPGMDQGEVMLQRLSGMVKYALREHGGWIHLEHLAAAAGQRVDSIRAGLDWLTARGDIQMAEQDGCQIRFVRGGISDRAQCSQAERRLKALLKETRAYRNYYARVDTDILFETDLA
ncbi:MAG: single-stranded-DNA-specific exonuclease RecJ [Anaerolineaceae bacterium]|nr:single-stranded-DNA-specific exonuclease RecJ [Anaerolineaceae bacterium]